MKNVLLFGVSCVGKTSTGRALSEKLGWDFHDIDDEVKKSLDTTLEQFVNTGTIESRDKVRGKIIGRLIEEDANKVIAVTPMSYRAYFEKYIRLKNVIAILLTDTPENIIRRLVFSDENDNEYYDDAYVKAHRKYYLSEIGKDLEWYGRVYSVIPHRVMINNNLPEEVAERIIRLYQLIQYN